MTKTNEPSDGDLFDLSSVDTGKASDEGAELELEHPTTGAKLGVFINLLGKHSTVFRQIVKERIDRAQRQNAVASRTGKMLPPPTAEQMEREAVELLAACTKGWRSGDKPFIRLAGEDIKFTPANAIRLYSEQLWIREQVDNFIGDLENFIKA